MLIKLSYKRTDPTTTDKEERTNSGIKTKSRGKQTNQNKSNNPVVSLCVLELLGEPVQTLIETLAVGGACGLDVPVALAQ